MACPHVCGLVTALLDKGDDETSDTNGDTDQRKLLNENYRIDIGSKEPDNSTGLGFILPTLPREICTSFLG